MNVGQTHQPASVVERAALTILIAAFFAAGYFSSAQRAASANSHDLTSELDLAVPFIGQAVWIYLGAFVIIASPAALLNSRGQLRQVALSYVCAIAVSLGCFYAFPVNSYALRAPLDDLDGGHLSERVVALLYTIDPPYNLFPSLHVSLVTLASLSLLASGRIAMRSAALAIALTAVSACLIKQHALADVAAGFLLGFAMAIPFYQSRRVPRKRLEDPWG